MQHRTRISAVLATTALLFTGLPETLPANAIEAAPNTDPILWYNQPASETAFTKGKRNFSNAAERKKTENEEWQQTVLPVGNGDLGATIYGEVNTEHVVINEKTVWTGGPGSVDNYTFGNDEAKGRNGAALREVQRLFEAKETDKAVKYANDFLVGFKNHNSRRVQQGQYEALSELFIDHGFNEGTQYSNYRRDLNLRTGVSSVNFTVDGVTYTREFLASHPNNVLAVRLTASTEEGLNVSLRMPQNIMLS